MTATPRDLTRTVLAVLFIAGLIAASFVVVQPFLAATVWATTLVIATWPMLLRAQALLGGRRWAAVTVMTLGLLLIVLLPLLLAIAAVVANLDRIVSLAESIPKFHAPGPPGWLADVPVVGAPAVERWARLAASDMSDVVNLVRPHVGTISRWFVGVAGSLGGLAVHLLLTIGIAAILFATGETAGSWCRRFGNRLADERGEQAVVLAGQAIRSVALGVVVTAIAQALVAGIGLAIAGVPQAGVLSALVLLLCIAQLGPALVLVPVVIWLFVSGATVAGIVLVVFTVMALTLDNVLRPLMIRRGADLPLLLILAGVIGGLLAFGLLGLFLGPVVLAVTYTLLQNWIAAREPPISTADRTD